MRPHRRQPTRLPCPWDSTGKNTGVGCHFLLQCMKVKSESKVTQSCLTLSDPMDCSPPGSSIHGIFQARVLEWGAIAFSNLNSHIYTFAHITRCLGMVGTLACSWEQCSSFIWPYLLSINIRTTTSFKLTEYHYCVVFFFFTSFELCLKIRNV